MKLDKKVIGMYESHSEDKRIWSLSSEIDKGDNVLVTS